MGLLWPATQQTIAQANSSYLICVMNYLSKLFYSNVLLFICMTLGSTGPNCMKQCSNLIESQLANMFRESVLAAGLFDQNVANFTGNHIRMEWLSKFHPVIDVKVKYISYAFVQLKPIY